MRKYLVSGNCGNTGSPFTREVKAHNGQWAFRRVRRDLPNCTNLTATRIE